LKNYYCLPNAGVKVCWSCADLYDEAEVRLHFGPMHAKLDPGRGLMTENGHKLPFVVTKDSPHRWRGIIGYAVDSYGKRWSLRKDHEVVKLKPLGA